MNSMGYKTVRAIAKRHLYRTSQANSRKFTKDEDTTKTQKSDYKEVFESMYDDIPRCSNR